MKIIKHPLKAALILFLPITLWGFAFVATTGIIQLLTITGASFLIGAITTYRYQSEQPEQPEQPEQNNTENQPIHNHHSLKPDSIPPSVGLHLKTVKTTQDEPEPSSILVDENILQQIIKDTDVSVMPELIKCYITESKDRVETIVKAAHNKDLYALEFESHTLGSSSLTLGNVALSTLAREIELHCLQQEFHDALKKADLLPTIAHDSFTALEIRNAQGFTK